jgi:hypothetical protein
MKMKHTDMFASFINDFEELKDYCGVNDSCALGLLLSNGSTELKIAMLPTRFAQDIEYAKRHKMDYQAMKAYLTQQDSQAQEAGIGEEVKESNIRAVSRDTLKTKEALCEPCAPKIITCYGCGNDRAHMSKECKLDACTFCKEFRCGHTSFDCPKRKKKSKEVAQSSKGAKHKNTRGDDKKKDVKDRKRKEEHEESEQDEDNSSQSDSPAKKKRNMKKRSQARSVKHRVLSSTSSDDDIWDPPSP